MGAGAYSFHSCRRPGTPAIELVLPWRRTESPEVLAKVFHDADIAGVRLAHHVDAVPFRAEDWPAIVMGSGLRRIAVDLGPQSADAVNGTERWAREQQFTTVRVSSIYATAGKPPRDGNSLPPQQNSNQTIHRLPFSRSSLWLPSVIAAAMC